MVSFTSSLPWKHLLLCGNIISYIEIGKSWPQEGHLVLVSPSQQIPSDPMHGIVDIKNNDGNECLFSVDKNLVNWKFYVGIIDV